MSKLWKNILTIFWVDLLWTVFALLAEMESGSAVKQMMKLWTQALLIKKKKRPGVEIRFIYSNIALNLSLHLWNPWALVNLCLHNTMCFVFVDSRWPQTTTTWRWWRRWRCLSMRWTTQLEMTWPSSCGWRVPALRCRVLLLYTPLKQWFGGFHYSKKSCFCLV